MVRSSVRRYLYHITDASTIGKRLPQLDKRVLVHASHVHVEALFILVPSACYPRFSSVGVVHPALLSVGFAVLLHLFVVLLFSISFTHDLDYQYSGLLHGALAAHHVGPGHTAAGPIFESGEGLIGIDVVPYQQASEAVVEFGQDREGRGGGGGEGLDPFVEAAGYVEEVGDLEAWSAGEPDDVDQTLEVFTQLAHGLVADDIRVVQGRGGAELLDEAAIDLEEPVGNKVSDFVLFY